MSPVIRIAVRRIKQNLPKSVFLMVAVLFSMLVVSFFFFFELQNTLAENPVYKDLPFTEFMTEVRLCMNIAIAFLVLITFATIRIHCGMRNEENSQILAILTSVGATAYQKRTLLFTEAVVIYLPSIVLGTILGAIPGILIGNYFQGVSDISSSNYATYVVLGIVLIIIGSLLVLVSIFFPQIKLKRNSVIQVVKKQNNKASEQRHGYRQSQTFQNQILLKRLAKKSIDYYGTIYNRIALSFSFSALYPVMAILLFSHIGNTNVVLDTNPFDRYDTATSVLAVIDKMLLFLGACFLVLSLVGIVQAILMARMQFLARKQSASLYLSIGMLKSDIKKMIRLEIQSVCVQSLIILLFGVVIINACFIMVAG